MSRKATDLSGVTLTRGERISKFCGTTLPRWFYNKEDGSYLGERTPKKWGKLLLYFFVLYSGITLFYFICHTIMLASVPRLPDNIYFCSADPKSLDPLRCRDGPRFKALRINDVGGNPTTSEIMSQGLVEPTLSSFPTNVYVGKTNPINVGNVDDSNKQAYLEVNANRPYNWGGVVSEARRASCDTTDSDVDTALTVGQCDATLVNRIFPTQLPKQKAGTYTKSPFESGEVQDVNFFLNLEDTFYGKSERLPSGDDYYPPRPYAENVVMKDVSSFGDDRTVHTYLIMFRLNKMWNYEPMDRRNKGTKISDYAQIVNDIGVKCYFSDKRCKKGDNGVNYKGELVDCDVEDDVSIGDKLDNDGNWDLEYGTLSKDGAMKIDMITPVMSKPSGFPWIGGQYDLSFGAALITWDTAKSLGTKSEISNLNAPKIACEWGRQIKGQTWNGTEITTIPISNRQRDGYGGVTNPNNPEANIIAFQLS